VRITCPQFVGFGRHCARCKYTWLLHDDAAKVRTAVLKAPTLTVIDGGKDKDEDHDWWSAWLNGEVL
jgi:hypothetical protein